MNKQQILTFLLILGLAATFSSCDKDKLSKCENGKCENTLHPNSKLEVIEDTIIQDINIVSGTQLVFKHQFEQNEKANISDDEFWDWIYFEIDPSLDKFSYVDAELSQINALYEYSCFCFGPFHFRIVRGSISGTKNGDSWDVTVDVEIDRDEGFIVSKAFSNVYE